MSGSHAIGQPRVPVLLTASAASRYGIYITVSTSEGIMDLQVSKWGNSLAMRIPSEIVRRFGLRDGDTLDAQLSVDGALTLRPAGWSRRAFAGELDAARVALPVGSSVMDELRRAARY